MSIIIVSNRLPYKGNAVTGAVERSAGGLATALGPLSDRMDSAWVGMWDPAGASKAEYQRMLNKHHCVPVHLSAKERKGYYDGYSNSTVWPLFHGFTQYATFDEDMWHAYVQVNRKFCDAVLSIAKPDDTIWVQDYQLLLLPAMLRRELPQASIGLFLHIPFPTYEMFRILPQRRELLEGMLGADLIGFHTYDYVRHFLSSLMRILGVENQLGTVWADARMVKADVFPLGIDYQKFAAAGASRETEHVVQSMLTANRPAGTKSMLSVERLDYTKGIADRLRAYEAFLVRYPEWRGRVTLSVITVPSREDVPSYKRLKGRIDQLVGRINGRFATPSWQPIYYYYQSMPFQKLVAFYRDSDVMLVTPLRDGMNLVAKEYLATHDGTAGVLILSEMAGSARELGDAILVNPYDQNQMVQAMHDALTMPEGEQLRRNAIMQDRLRRYTSARWAEAFLDELAQVKERQGESKVRTVDDGVRTRMVQAYGAADKRILFLDYDGTLMPFVDDPAAAAPDDGLQRLLARLAADSRTSVVIISGRDRATMERWFADLGVEMVAEHGAWVRTRADDGWRARTAVSGAWKERVRPLLQAYVDSTPGSLLEEKDYSLVWHYRAVERELAARRITEMRTALSSVVEDTGLQLSEGNKIVEVKVAGVDKGSAVADWLDGVACDFALTAGDDTTDEDMFRSAAPDVWTVKVGSGPTCASYRVKDCFALRDLLQRFADAGAAADAPGAGGRTSGCADAPDAGCCADAGAADAPGSGAGA